MTTSYPDEDEDLGVSDAVLALRHSDHRELGRTLTLRHQVAYLGHKKYLVKLVAKDALAKTYKWELSWTLALRHQVAYLGHKKYLVKLVAKDALARTYKWETELITGTPTPGLATGHKKYLVKLVAKDALARIIRGKKNWVEHWHSDTRSRTWAQKVSGQNCGKRCHINEKLSWTLTLRHQVPHLGTKSFWSN